MTGIPCSGCGGIRSARYLLSGHMLSAIYTNPLSQSQTHFFSRI
ncbi:MAG: DUF2752 domain-containing protein [Bacteroidales bacterium]|nr:DUF2752 domain-containing protein [Bacteroidales bacterium]